MNAPVTDTRSIGQVLYEALVPSVTRTDWAKVLSLAGRERFERAAELVYRRGHKAGSEFQKTASPPPKAKHLGAQLVQERLAWAEKRKEFVLAARQYIEAQSCDSVPVRVAARERLLAVLEALS